MIRKLWSYVWPKDRPQIRRRVVIAVALLVGSKFLNVTVPFLFGAIIDLLNKNAGNILNVTTDAATGGLTVIFAMVVGCTYACMLIFMTI